MYLMLSNRQCIMICMFATSKSGSIRTGVLLLSSCWKHYSMLLRLEDHKVFHSYKELLEQYLSGLQVRGRKCCIYLSSVMLMFVQRVYPTFVKSPLLCGCIPSSLLFVCLAACFYFLFIDFTPIC